MNAMTFKGFAGFLLIIILLIMTLTTKDIIISRLCAALLVIAGSLTNRYLSLPVSYTKEN